MEVSKKLIFINLNNNDYLVYHQYYGNPRLIDGVCYDFLCNNIINKDLLIDEYKDDWFDCGFLLADDSDEETEFQKLIESQTRGVISGKKIYILDLVISQRCNLSCPHCIYFSGNTRYNDVGSMMSYEIALSSFIKYIELCRKNAISEFDIHLGGAEPLLNWIIIKKILDNFPGYLIKEEKIFWSINTNLLLVNPEVAEYFKKFNIAIHGSLDGDEFSNNKIRIYKSGKGTFNQIISKIEFLNKFGCKVSSVAITLTKDNFNSFNTNIISIIKELNINKISIDIDLVSSKDIPIELAARKLVDFFWACQDQNIECSGTWLTPFLNIVNKDIRKMDVSFCGAMRGINLGILPSGDVVLCIYSGNKIGNIDDFENLFLENSLFSSLLSTRQPMHNSICKNCILEVHCAGQCQITYEISEHSGDFSNFYQMCDFYRKVTDLMLLTYANNT